MSYSNKLKDPRWQKLRLRVFERDAWKCVSCGETSKTLHVHHKVYHREPWDADLDELATLCHGCHENIELAIQAVRENPQIRALPHIIKRTEMLYEVSPGWSESLLKCGIALCKQTEK